MNKMPIELIRGEIEIPEYFHKIWESASRLVPDHPLWDDEFAVTLRDPDRNLNLSYALVEQWAKQMFHGSSAFPRYVGNLVGRVKNHSAGRMLAINAAVERGYPDESRSHFLLAVDLLNAMGYSNEEIAAIPVEGYSEIYIDGHLDYTRDSSLASAVGCLGIGIETLTTEEFTMLGGAFIRTAPPVKNMPLGEVYQSQGYFTENIMADAEHKTEFEKIAFLLWKSGEIHQDLEVCSREIENGAKFSLDSRREFFEGIYADVTGA